MEIRQALKSSLSIIPVLFYREEEGDTNKTDRVKDHQDMREKEIAMSSRKTSMMNQSGKQEMLLCLKQERLQQMDNIQNVSSKTGSKS